MGWRTQENVTIYTEKIRSPETSNFDLASYSWFLRDCAIEGLDISEAIPRLVELLYHEDTHVQRNAAGTLEKTAENGADIFDAVSRLIELAVESDWDLLKRHVTSALENFVENGSKENFIRVRKRMQDEIKKEKDPVRKLRLKIIFARFYRKTISNINCSMELDGIRPLEMSNVKTLKLPKRRKGKFRMRRVRNG